MARALRFCWFAPALALCGCLHMAQETVVKTTAPERVNKCSGDCVELKTEFANNQAALLRKVGEMLAEDSKYELSTPAEIRVWPALDAMLTRHLDDAIDILRQHDFKRQPTEADCALAHTVDSHLGHPADDGWGARLEGRGHGGVERAEEILAKAHELQRKQEWRAAIDLIQNQQKAVAAYPYHAIHAGLIMAEAQRRLGQTDAAATSWQHAVQVAAPLLTRWPAPALWEELAAYRPVGVAWPASITDGFAATLPAPLHDLPRDPKFAVEALIWLHIGNARLERSEASLALPAFKHADSHGAFPLWDDFLALYQAKALLALQQTPAATSLLTVLTNRPNDFVWGRPALAILGAGKLSEGHTQQALAFLHEAVDNAPGDFLWLADAEANLGLALLGAGDQANGIQWLHRAQQRFGANKDYNGLRLCLANEEAYFSQGGQTTEADAVHQRIRVMEANIH